MLKKLGMGAVFTIGAVYLIAAGSHRGGEPSQRLLLAGIVLTILMRVFGR